ncbi:ATPase AAA [Thermosipho melanesiensis]|uniref:ATPase AAA n=2 Tax=Thermosipho melanesiensis TaxID=46541 RepID=A0ABN4UUZ7_9BACT|nr:IGHMBP2 family helicase [Thermosipho melanesiensis]ABR30762.1 putative DNA helicase [Thermosipho melanesiensis BI429]APT73885.1 ATPase AAA [Thermosipho melanesiensis]OOC35826.1 ATPase AAA [Thermosipho melanesiensis]OOC38328.1 ATPase AAA [Thermosipho melanesiensis]OOC38789.1 ATPase AAA [Thermosipho melanesiensis]
MEEYIKKLIQLVKLERDEEIKRMQWEMKNLTGKQRENKGRAILDLSPKIIGEELGMYLVKFGRKKQIETEIGTGDEVIISKGNPTKSDIKGVVTERGKRFIVVSLSNLLPKDFKNVRIDLYASDITYKRQIDNLENNDVKKILKYILSDPKVVDNGTEEFTPIDNNLNEYQKLAISKALKSEDFSLIHGPFGTGKTRTLAEYILQEAKKGKKILVTADSNLAVDNLVERLSESISHVRIGHPSRISSHLLSSSLMYKIQTHNKYKEIEKLKKTFEKLIQERESFQKPIPKWKRGLTDKQILKLAENNKSQRGIPLKIIKDMAKWIKLNEKIETIKENIYKIEEEISKDIINNSMVVFTTNSSAYIDILKDYEFDVVVVDEATQSTIPSVLIPLSKGKKFVLAGDHKQLPPTILSEKAKELSTTLFEMLIKKYPQKSEILKIQYRMNERLMEFPNKEFYNNLLISGVKNITLKDLNFKGKTPLTNYENVLIFIDTSCLENYEEQRKDSTSYINKLEANVIKNIVESFINEGAKREWIGVISPYDDQVELIRSFDLKIDVNTVDGFQGREKEIILISFVRSNKNGELGFLNDLRRLNVSLTRAKRKLILIGNSNTLIKNQTYKRLINFIKKGYGGIKWLEISSLI